MAGLVASSVKAVIRLGGTGVPYVTPLARDVIYSSPYELGTGEDGSATVSPHAALTYIPFFAGVRLISEDVGALPLNLYQKQGAAGGRRSREDHELYPILHDNPNPYMTAMTFREVLQGHALTWGNGYAEKEIAPDGRLLGLWPMRPDRMAVLMDTASGAVFYRYQWSDGKVTDLPWWKVFHIHGLGFDGFVGYSVVAMARRSIGMAIAGEKFAAGYMQKGNVPPAVLKAARSYTDPALENIRRSWDEIDHRNRVAILEEGLDLQIVGLPPKDVQFLESADHLRGLMATLLRLPPHKLGDVEKSTSWGTGIEQQDIGYLKHTLNPLLVRWEQEIKLRLLGEEPTLYVKHSLDALLRADTTARWRAYVDGIYNGVWTINDVLRFEDRNPISEAEGGDLRRAPLNMVPLDQWMAASLAERLELARTLTAAGLPATDSAAAANIPAGLDLEPAAPAPPQTSPFEPTPAGSNGGPPPELG